MMYFSFPRGVVAAVLSLGLAFQMQAQDMDDVTSAEEVQMEAAETGGLDAIDESLAGVLDEAADEGESVDTGDELSVDEGLFEDVTVGDGDVIVDESAGGEVAEFDEEVVDEMAVEEEAVTDDAMTGDVVDEEYAAVDEEVVEEEEKGVDEEEEGLSESDLMGEGEGELADEEIVEASSDEMTTDSEDVMDELIEESTEESVTVDVMEESDGESSTVDLGGDGETGSLDAMIDDAMAVPAPDEREDVDPVADVSDATPSRATIAVPAPSRRTFSNAELVEQEANRRKALEIHALETLKRADKAYYGKDYARAGKLYEEVLKHLGDRAAVRDEKAKAAKMSGRANYFLAVALKKQGKLEEAAKAAQISLNREYRPAAKLLNEIQAAINKGGSADAQPAAEPAEPQAVWKQEAVKQERKNIDQLLKEGKQFLAVGDLDSAGQRFEMILKRQPYNAEAIRLLEKTAVRKYDRASQELEATRRNMITDVRKTWNPRDYAAGVVSKGPSVDDGTGGPTLLDTNRMTEAEKIEEQMKKIIIPEIDFRQFNINDVVNFFQEASYESGGLGINFLLHLGGDSGGMSGGMEDEGEFGSDEDSNPMDELASSEVPLITFRARNISLYKALKTVTKVAGLRYSVEDGVVMILRKGETTDDLITRFYDVLPTFIERVDSLRGQVGGGGAGDGWGGGETDDGLSEGSGLDSGTVELKPFFAQMGVEWPNKSEISYVSAVGRLIVKNTEENLVQFERILGMINIVPSQIEIEARFVEVNQTDAQELGFEWMLTDDWEVAEKTTASGSLLGTAQYVQLNADDEGGLTKGLRFAEEIDLESPADDIVTVASVLTNPELAFVIHALQQKGNADLLSAPKVTTQSGVAARISVVTEYVYPTEFTVTPITGTSENGTTTIVGGVVEPSSFNMREVGVVLEVTPEVTSDGKMISLVMAPKVVTEPTWKNYGSTYTAPDGSTQQLTMEQPFFHTRSVETQVLIYNGATVVMGGMINESRVEVDDMVPLLGEIPIIGRLFQSKYETTEKRNLLIFVTARLVDPSGKSLITPDLTLMPDVAKISDEE